MTTLIKMLLGFLLLSSVSLFASDKSEWQQVNKIFDGESISLSVLARSVDVSDSHSAAALAAGLPKGGEFLGMYSNDAQGYNMWFIGVRRAQGKATTSEYFNGLKKYSRENYGELLSTRDFKSRLVEAEKAYTQSLAQSTGARTERTSQITYLGIFDESPRHFSALVLTRTTSRTDVSSNVELSIGSLSYFYLNGKVITLNLATKYTGDETHEPILELTRAVAKAHLATNR